MKQFDYTITDALGIHARPAGLLAKEAKQFQSVCTITKGVSKGIAKGKLYFYRRPDTEIVKKRSRRIGI